MDKSESFVGWFNRIVANKSKDFLKKKKPVLFDEEEKQVFELHLTGMTYTEIAKVLGRDEKSTDNALQRMKTKIKKLLKENSIK